MLMGGFMTEFREQRDFKVERFKSNNNWAIPRNCSCLLTAGFLYKDSVENPEFFLKRFWKENFSRVDTQTAILVSIDEIWILRSDS